MHQCQNSNFKIRPINSKFFYSGLIFSNPLQVKMKRGIRIRREGLKKFWCLGSSRRFMIIYNLDQTTHNKSHIST